MKSYLSTLFGKWLILGSAILVLVASTIGFLIDAQGFLGNFLAEIAGVFVSIVVALLIVDKFLEYQKEQQWIKVRKLTYEALAAHLCDLAVEMLLHFPVSQRSMTQISEGRAHPNPDTMTGMGKLASQLRQLPSAVSAEKSTSDLSVEYYEGVKWDLDQIRDVLTPRVVQSSSNQEVIDALVEFDNARRNLHNAIIVHKRIVTHGVFPDVIELLERTQALYGALCKKWV